MPTPGAVGLMMQTVSKQQNINVVGVDIGGATTDVFSVFEDIFNRTVSANLGMSYSVSNVLAEAGLDDVMRWVPFKIDEADLRDRIKNKMIRPTTIPQMLEELQVEQAIAREALRLAFVQHRALAVGLKGIQAERTLSDVFDQSAGGESLIKMRDLDLLVGSGGVLSHAPRRMQTAAMLIDAFQPEGITRLAVDSIFMMPHLGVLSSVNEIAATQVFERDCLIYLGTCIAPIAQGKIGAPCTQYEIGLPDGTQSGTLNIGDLLHFPLEADQEAHLTLQPERNTDAGAGPGRELNTTVKGGTAGLILDGRGRPIIFAENQSERADQISRWSEVLDLYPR